MVPFTMDGYNPMKSDIPFLTVPKCADAGNRKVTSTAGWSSLLLILGVALVAGCATVPELPEEYDQEPAGRYRGVVAKESLTGTFLVEFFPEDTRGPGEPVFHFSLGYQGERIEERASGLSDDTEAGRRLCYAGTIGSGEQELSAELVLDLTPAGTVREVTFMVDGAPAAAIAAKERTDRQVLTFEGRFSGTSSGIWNMLIAGESSLAAYAEEPAAMRGVLRGSVAGEALSLTGAEGRVTASGTVAENEVSGSWDERIGEPGSGSFRGNRSAGGLQP
jgi:hypothetical protein